MNALLPGELVELRNSIESQSRTVHAFCRRHSSLSRSTVYQVLAGRYAGNMARQAAKIRDVLDATPAPLPGITAATLAGVLQEVKCNRCRRSDKRGCRGCRIQTGREAGAVARFLADMYGGCHANTDF